MPILAFLLSLLGASMSEPAPPLDRALRAFAADLSGGDPAIAARVDAILANPPTTLEELGFYGSGDASPKERAFRATVFALSEAGHITPFEDKYIHELPQIMAEAGWIPDPGPYIAGIAAAYEAERDSTAIDTLARDGFADHLTYLVPKSGRGLVYIDLPLGDTFHLAEVPAEIAAKWADTLFLQIGAQRFAVTAPQWDLYWGFLTYALRLDGAKPAPIAPYDPGRLRPLTERGF